MSSFSQIYKDGTFTPTQKIAKFVIELMQLAQYFHLEHFHEKSGFRHERLQVIYEALPDWADRISEYFDNSEAPLNYDDPFLSEITWKYMAPGGLTKYLEVIKKLRAKIITLNVDPLFSSNIGFQNILGEMEEKLGQQYYALSKIS